MLLEFFPAGCLVRYNYLFPWWHSWGCRSYWKGHLFASSIWRDAGALLEILSSSVTETHSYSFDLLQESWAYFILWSSIEFVFSFARAFRWNGSVQYYHASSTCPSPKLLEHPCHLIRTQGVNW